MKTKEQKRFEAGLRILEKAVTYMRVADSAQLRLKGQNGQDYKGQYEYARKKALDLISEAMNLDNRDKLCEAFIARRPDLKKWLIAWHS